jgi:hypothetical protein
MMRVGPAHHHHEEKMMSSRRRKTIGQEKIRRNLLRRVVRGARKAGAPLPGFGAWRDEYLRAEDGTVEGAPAKYGDGHYVLVDYAKVVRDTEELRERVKALAEVNATLGDLEAKSDA